MNERKSEPVKKQWNVPSSPSSSPICPLPRLLPPILVTLLGSPHWPPRAGTSSPHLQRQSSTLPPTLSSPTRFLPSMQPPWARLALGPHAHVLPLGPGTPARLCCGKQRPRNQGPQFCPGHPRGPPVTSCPSQGAPEGSVSWHLPTTILPQEKAGQWGA